VIRLVEEAEAHRADVQRIADKFSAWYLPVVAIIAVLTFLLRRDPLATAAVLVVACSCSFALATPIAMLASIGAGAKRGLLVKGGKYVELLARADVLLVDKTGTLTLGQPQITDMIMVGNASRHEAIRLAASAERFSEHPFADAIRRYAANQQIKLYEPNQFEALPGQGVRAQVNGVAVSIGNARLIPQAAAHPEAAKLQEQGKTLLFMTCNGRLTAIFAAADTLRGEVPDALQAAKKLGIQKLELLTGDNEQVASELARQLGIAYRANLLPEDKIAIVKTYQQQGHTVIMVGDGINDAPALAQADIGIAMGAAGTGIALEAAHVALMRDDWRLVPELLNIARRTMRIVKMNIAFTVVYNIIGLTLAAFGILPPMLAAAAQSFPDLGILANSSRLLRYQSLFDANPMPSAAIQKNNAVAVAEVKSGEATDECCTTDACACEPGPVISLDSIR
jgi:P-type Cu+ transporter